MKRRGRRGWLAAALMVILPGAGPAAAQTGQEAGHARIVALLDKSGFSYTKIDDGVWEVPATGKNYKQFAIRVIAAGDLVLVIARIADRRALSLKEPLLIKIAELNHHFDTARLALSEEMLYTRMDIHARLLDDPAIKYMIQQTAEVADETYPHVKPFLRE